MKLIEPIYKKNVNNEPAQSRQSICSHTCSKDVDYLIQAKITLVDPVDI